MLNHADRLTVAHKRCDEHSSNTGSFLDGPVFWELFSLFRDVMYVYRLPINDCSTNGCATIRPRIPIAVVGIAPKYRHASPNITLNAKDQASFASHNLAALSAIVSITD